MTDQTLADILEAAMNTGSKTVTIKTPTLALLLHNARTARACVDLCAEDSLAYATAATLANLDRIVEAGAEPNTATLAEIKAMGTALLDLFDAASAEAVKTPTEVEDERSALYESLAEGVSAARAVVENWSSNRLADSVNMLDGWIEQTVEEWPDMGPLDAEDETDAYVLRIEGVSDVTYDTAEEAEAAGAASGQEFEVVPRFEEGEG